jgi:hypothetical protein
MRRSIWFILIGLLAFTPSVRAGILYSVNVQTDQLVKIETTTGSVSVVGPIGHQMQGTDLASLDGLIYATTQKTPGFNLDGMTLVAIDPSSGAKVSSADMRLGTNEVFAEGLTAANGQLVVSFDHLSLTSVRTGVVDPTTGAISDPQFHGPDLDELGTDLTGQIVAIDGENYSGNTRQMAFYHVDRNPAGGAFIGDFLLQGSLNDIVFTPFGVFSFNAFDQNLYRLDLTGWPSIVETIPLGPIALQLSGMAYVPEPSTYALAALGIVALLVSRRRKSTKRG